METLLTWMGAAATASQLKRDGIILLNLILTQVWISQHLSLSVEMESLWTQRDVMTMDKDFVMTSVSNQSQATSAPEVTWRAPQSVLQFVETQEFLEVKSVTMEALTVWRDAVVTVFSWRRDGSMSTKQTKNQAICSPLTLLFVEMALWCQPRHVMMDQ